MSEYSKAGGPWSQGKVASEGASMEAPWPMGCGCTTHVHQHKDGLGPVTKQGWDAGAQRQKPTLTSRKLVKASLLLGGSVPHLCPSVMSF